MPTHRCFISAAYGEKLEALQEVLDSLNVAWEWGMPSSLHQPLMKAVRDAIDEADFIIGVLHNHNPRANVLVELGVAIGLRKPLFLLKTGDVEIPTDLSGWPIVDTELGDRKLLTFQLDLFLRTLAGKQSTKRTLPFPELSDTLTKNIPSRELFESSLEQSVAAAISRAGGSVTIPPRTGKERTPDLLMWLPKIDKELFNPAAIEVVVAPPNRLNLNVLQERFASFIRNTGLKCGLIVVKSVSVEKALRRLPPLPYIFVLTLHELNARLEASDLASWVKRERSRLAHGVR